MNLYFIPGNKVISKYIHLIKYKKLSGNFSVLNVTSYSHFKKNI